MPRIFYFHFLRVSFYKSTSLHVYYRSGEWKICLLQKSNIFLLNAKCHFISKPHTYVTFVTRVWRLWNFSWSLSSSWTSRHSAFWYCKNRFYLSFYLDGGLSFLKTITSLNLWNGCREVTCGHKCAVARPKVGTHL